MGSSRRPDPLEQRRVVATARVAEVADEDAADGEARFDLRTEDAIAKLAAQDARDVLLGRHPIRVLVAAPQSPAGDNAPQAERQGELAKRRVERLAPALPPRRGGAVEIPDEKRVPASVAAPQP